MEHIALGEGFTTEFKRSGMPNLGREICAFANAGGGVILIGVEDDGAVCGVSDHNRLKSEIQSIARNIKPPVVIEMESAEEVLCVNVPPQHSKPYSAGGKFFIREGPNSQQMSHDEIREFFHREGLIHFDETPCGRFSLDADLDEENWSLFRRRAKIPKSMQPETALRNLRLLSPEGRMTHAGAWLLAHDIRKFNISAAATCALFMGTSKTRILDRRGFHGDIYSMIDETVAWVLSKINVEYIIRRVKREEMPELPEEAIREAIVNAVAHRDYRSTASTQICLFSDRLEIVSPGGLPAGMTREALGSGSMLRNPLLFSILHRMDAVENIGSGIRRIRKLCHAHGVAEPVFEASEHWVIVTFMRSKIPPSERYIGDSSPPQPESQPESRPESQQKRLAQKVLALLCQGDLAKSEISASLGHKTVSGHLNKTIRNLLSEDLIEYTIPDRPRSRLQRYQLTEKGREFVEAPGEEGE